MKLEEKIEYDYQMKIREMNKWDLIFEITKHRREIKRLNNYIKSLQNQNRQLQKEILKNA